VAHHFNNKLQVITGRLALALRYISNNDQAAYSIMESQKAAHQAAEVSLMMLNYLGQGKMTLETLDLGEVCQEAVNVQARLLPSKIQLTVLQPLKKFKVKGNRIDLIQAMASLFNNAREAIGDRTGRILLSCTMFHAGDLASLYLYPTGWQPKKDIYACLEISDNGCGIGRENMDLIFDPFFSTKFIGRGLGL
jgi:signal transduction histidine kinase